MLWKNGVATALTDGTHNAAASSVAISGSDVYVSGWESNGINNIAYLWKNGVGEALTDGTLSAGAAQVIISGTDVYVAGGESGIDAQNNYQSNAGYWKNGVYTALLTAVPAANPAAGYSGGGYVAAIAIEGSDIYVAGAQYEFTLTGPGTAVVNDVPTYWKNGQAVALTDGLNPATAGSIAVVGTDVYVAGGNCLSEAPDCFYAVYWKNGVMTQLPAAPSIVASGIAVSGSNVYMATNGSNSAGGLAQYWVNDTPTTLYNSPVASANGIVLYGTDVYVVGAQLGGACYWKNGNLQSITGGQYPSIGGGIAVVQP